MGLGDFFRNLFGGSKPKVKSEELSIDLTEDGMTINGRRIDIPCHLDILKDMLGKPIKTGKKAHGNYKWDTLGLRCYTNSGNNVVTCIGVKTKAGECDTKHDPTGMFKGVLTINGEPWEEFMSHGVDEEVARQQDFGVYSLFSEYADFEVADTNGCKGAYVGVEISIKLSAAQMDKLRNS